jgi:hypothetical protein
MRAVRGLSDASSGREERTRVSKASTSATEGRLALPDDGEDSDSPAHIFDRNAADSRDCATGLDRRHGSAPKASVLDSTFPAVSTIDRSSTSNRLLIRIRCRIEIHFIESIAKSSSTRCSLEERSIITLYF